MRALFQFLDTQLVLTVGWYFTLMKRPISIKELVIVLVEVM